LQLFLLLYNIACLSLIINREFHHGTCTYFDTPHFANKLKTVGIPAKQAKTQAETIAEIINETEKHIALKVDVEKAMLPLNSEIQNFRLEIKHEFENANNKYTFEIARVSSKLKIYLIKLYLKMKFFCMP
jgi:hypothetical protein